MTTRRARAVPTSLAAAIHEARTEAGWTQWELAVKLSTRENNVRNWESGRNTPSHAHYSRMCLLFGWSLPYSEDRATARKLGRPGWVSPSAHPELVTA